MKSECRNPNHALTDGSPSPHEIGPSCMAEAMTTERQAQYKRALDFYNHTTYVGATIPMMMADFAELEIALAAPAIKAEGRREGLEEIARFCDAQFRPVQPVSGTGQGGAHSALITVAKEARRLALLSTPAPKEKA